MSLPRDPIVVVGAGPGGLATALLLRQRGFEVVLLEKRASVGGRTGAIEAEGYTFDIGPTFFLYPRVLEEIFRSCGYDLREEVPMKRLDPMYRVAFEGGGHLDTVGGLQAMQAEIARLSRADAARLPAYMKDNRHKLTRFRNVLESQFSSLFSFLRPDVLLSLPMLRPFTSLDSDLQRYFMDPRVRRAFSFQAKYLGMSPFQCPSLFTILAFLEHEFGIWHPVGGCNVIMKKMAEIALRMGVDIRLGEPVTGIDFDGRRPRAVLTPGGRIPASALVVNSDFAETMTRLVPDAIRRRWTDRRIAQKEFSCSTFMLYLGIEGRLDHVPHHVICLADDFEGNILDIQERKVLPATPSFYVQNACVTDETLAPPGHSTLYVLVPVPNETAGIDWDTVGPAFRERTLDRLSLIGIPDLRKRIRFEKMLTPKGWADELSIYRGATFNLSHTLGQMLYFRPHNKFEDLESVYLVGGGTHPGSGLPVIFESARISADLVAKQFGMRSGRTVGDSMSSLRTAREVQ